jgi:hypothetical protein
LCPYVNVGKRSATFPKAGKPRPLQCQFRNFPEAIINSTTLDLVGLLAKEAIKDVKARYCRFLDTKDWEGFGQYHETYRCVAGEWKIASLRLSRFHVDRHPA